jgi:S-adenosylmethionine-dependent methyltransferase
VVDDIGDIKKFYDTNANLEIGRLERHQLERDITQCYLDKYLPPDGTILDIGAAAGIYAILLAKKGYSVTAVDLSPNLIEQCRKRVGEDGLEDKISCYVADARDLSDVPGGNYDAALVLGPLYHLVVEEDRMQVLRQVWERLKPNGLIFSAFVSRYGIWGAVMRKLPHFIEKSPEVQSVLSQGRDTDLPIWKESFRGYFATVDEIVPLHEKMRFQTLVLAGVEPAGTGSDEAYNSLEGKRRQLWLDLLFSISTEKSIIGASEHILYVGKKKESR